MRFMSYKVVLCLERWGLRVRERERVKSLRSRKREMRIELGEISYRLV